MGLGGFFKYDKEGPGISKNAPEKHTFIVFFETWFRNVWKLMTSGFLYILSYLLLLPSGLGSVGLTHIARNIARDKHSFGVSDFFETIKKNWKQALVTGILNIVVTASIIVSGVLYYFDIDVDGWFGLAGAGLMMSIFFVVSVMKYYVWLLIITFKLPLRKIYKNSFYFVFLNMKNNLIAGIAILAFYGLAIGICWLFQYDLVIIMVAILTLCFFPGYKHLVIQYCVFPAVKKAMIDPYYEQHPDEDIELRRGLGLDVEEDEEEEQVFDDRQLLPSDEEE
jgi:uncharacterized membrane protein YesL